MEGQACLEVAPAIFPAISHLPSRMLFEPTGFQNLLDFSAPLSPPVLSPYTPCTLGPGPAPPPDGRAGLHATAWGPPQVGSRMLGEDPQVGGGHAQGADSSISHPKLASSSAAVRGPGTGQPPLLDTGL